MEGATVDANHNGEWHAALVEERVDTGVKCRCVSLPPTHHFLARCSRQSNSRLDESWLVAGPCSERGSGTGTWLVCNNATACWDWRACIIACVRLHSVSSSCR